jgi:hypothetical protein
LLFFRLPVDVYQTAKVSKLLLMIENGVPVEHKGKSLSEIDIDFKYADENDLKVLKSHYDDGVRNEDIVEDMEKDGSDEEEPEKNLGNFTKEDHLNSEESSCPPNKEKLCEKRQREIKICVDNGSKNIIKYLMINANLIFTADNDEIGSIMEEGTEDLKITIRERKKPIRTVKKDVEENVKRRTGKKNINSEEDNSSMSEDESRARSKGKQTVAKRNVAGGSGGDGNKRKGKN